MVVCPNDAVTLKIIPAATPKIKDLSFMFDLLLGQVFNRTFLFRTLVV